MRDFARPSVGPLVHWSVGPSVVIKLKSGETSVLDSFCIYFNVRGGLECGWELDAPAHMSATIL